MDKSKEKYWTHPSVLSFAINRDPVEVMIEKARVVVFEACQKGWIGPPFDPFKLAEILKIKLIPRGDILDAQTLPTKDNKFTIEFNPDRPKGRTNYSIAHELAHTFFPDCKDGIRQRHISQGLHDNWQLEMLCNIGASELLMPIGSFQSLSQKELTIESLMDLRKEFNVSTEALLIRMIRLREEPSFVFCSSYRKKTTSSQDYQIDYVVPSKTNLNTFIKPNVKLPKNSIVGECTAIGFTAKGEEEWPSIGKIHLECVGLPPYPGDLLTRVAGFVTFPQFQGTYLPKIKYLKGDATKPRGEDIKIIAFIINDKAYSWGAGFGKAVQTKWPFVLEEFQQWRKTEGHKFGLGATYLAKIESRLFAFEMVSQHGYGPSDIPKIRYSALETCLKKLAGEAIRLKASIHMPRIGAGEAGGSWWIISELIENILIRQNIDVTIYDLPKNKKDRQLKQLNFA